MENPRTTLSHIGPGPDQRSPRGLSELSLPPSYLVSDSDSDIDENDNSPPTIIKRKSEIPRKPKSKYKGVFRCGKKFKAQIQTNGVQHYLGLFDVEEDAARAYDVHARATLGPKAKTNFVYDANENIVPSDFVVMQGPLPEAVNNADHSSNRSKGSHPRRTYVGIKARRKRMSEGESLGNGESIDHDPAYSIPRKRLRSSDESLVDTVSADDHHVIQETPEQEDWREQLYHWKGHLSVDIPRKIAIWKGTWMTSWQIQQQQDGNAPNPSWDNNTFEYHCSSNLSALELIPQECLEYPNSLPLPPVGGNYSGFYMMDNDDGGVLSRYSDSRCVLDFESEVEVSSESPTSKGVNYFVVGKGESDFGTFILQGVYNPVTRSLEVTRKYVSSFDPRSSMSIPQIRESLKANPLVFPTLSPVSDAIPTEPNFLSSSAPSSISAFNSETPI